MLTRFNRVRVAHGGSLLPVTVFACFLGSADPFGGFGRVLPVLVALVVLQLPSSGLNLLGAIAHPTDAKSKTAEMGAEAPSGVTYGGIGQRTGVPPTEKEFDNIATALAAASKQAKMRGIAFGIDPANRYENHLLNTGWQAKSLIGAAGADHIFIHVDTCHMNIDWGGAGNGLLDAREHLRSIHISASDRGTPARARWTATRSERRSPQSASGADLLWRVSSICHPR